MQCFGSKQTNPAVLPPYPDAAQVPLDYTADKGNASIAIVRYPSTAPKSQYRGPILFNPGGPGNSGVTAIVSMGVQFAEFMGNQFDIVGFDPRGTFHSTTRFPIYKYLSYRCQFFDTILVVLEDSGGTSDLDARGH